jgi:hypothetical protein
MALTGFPNTIRVTLGPAWTGRFGLSQGTTIDLIKGSCANTSCQWSEDGTATFNKSTNRLMLLFNNNQNIPNTGYPNYAPTGSYGTALIQVAVGWEGYSSPSVSAPFPGWRQGTGPTRYNWWVQQKQYTFNGFTITHYNFKDIWNQQYTQGTDPNGSISTLWTGSAGTNSNDSGQNFTKSFLTSSPLGGIPADIFTTMEDASGGPAGISDARGTGTGHGEAVADGAHFGNAEAPGVGPGEASASGAHFGNAEAPGVGHGEAVSPKSIFLPAEGAGTGHGEAVSPKDAPAAVEGSGQGAGAAVSEAAAFSVAEGGGQGTGEATSAKDAVADPEGTGTGHGSSVGLTVGAADGVGTGTGHGEATPVAARFGASESSGTGHGEAGSLKDVLAGAEGTGTGHGSYASIPGGAGDTKATAQGHGEAAAFADIASAGDGSGQGTGEAVSVADVPANAEGPGTGHGEATSVKAALAGAEGTGAGHGESVSVADVPGDTKVTGQGHGEAVSSSFRMGISEGSGQGAGEAVAAAAVPSASEGSGQGAGEAVSLKDVPAGAEGTGTGHSEMRALRTGATKGTAQGHGEATQTSVHTGNGTGTGRGSGGTAVSGSTQPRGLQSIGVDQPPNAAQSNFPFIKPSDDIKRMFGDFYLSYEDPECVFALPFRVAWLAKFGEVVVPNFPGRPDPVNKYDLIVEDANGLVVFDSTEAIDFVTIEFSDRLEAIEWKTEKAICRAVRHTKSNPNEPPLIFDRFIEPEQSDLDVITYRQVPERVRSIRVGLTKLDPGDMIWDEGFNFGMAVQDPVSQDGGRFVRPILMSAQPGDGLGRVPGCEDVEPLVRRINNVGPNAQGGFLLDADGCYRIQRPTILTDVNPRTVQIGHPELTDEEAAAALHLFNDCGPCCECDDFVRTYKGLKSVFARYEELGVRAEDTRDQFAINKARWEEEAACRFERPSRIVLQQEFDCTIALGAMHCNNSDECITPLVLRLTIQAFQDGLPDPAAGGSFLCEETRRKGSDTNQNEIPFQFEGSFPILDSRFDSANAHETSRIRTRLRIPGCENGGALRITLTTHAPDFPEGSDATFPDVSVPTDVSDLWTSTGAEPDWPARSVLQKSIALNPVEACR